MPVFPPGAPRSSELNYQSKHIMKDTGITKITCAQGSWRCREMDNQRGSEKRQILFVHLWVRGSVAPPNSLHASCSIPLAHRPYMTQ